MARVAIISTAPTWAAEGAVQHVPARLLERCAEADRFGVHTHVADPRTADVILFADRSGMGLLSQRVWLDPWVLRYPERCFAFSTSDHPFPWLPGVYQSIPAAHHDPQRTRGGHYPSGLFRDVVRRVAAEPSPDPPRWLWSFVGNVGSAPVRQGIGALIGAPDSLVDNTRRHRGGPGPGPRFYGYKEQHWRRYLHTSRDSGFVLCPRGTGASSVRLFEVMQLGRVPVILSDTWVPPEGPDWASFSLRIPEAEVASVPRRLEALRSAAAEMGQRARAAWEAWFSEEVSFHRTVQWCLAIRRARRLPEVLARWRVLRRFADPELRAGMVGHASSKTRKLTRRLRAQVQARTNGG